MKLKRYIPPALLPHLKRVRKKWTDFRRRRHPSEVIKTNTRQAWEYFWQQDPYLQSEYLDPGRRLFYMQISARCVGALRELLSLDLEDVRLVDVGCGPGYMLEAISRQPATSSRVQMIGVDFSASGLVKAHRSLPAADLAQCDVYNLCLRSGVADLAICIETLEHLRDPIAAIHELLRICGPASRVLITVPDGELDSWEGHVNHWNLDELSRLLQPFGLHSVERIPFEDGSPPVLLAELRMSLLDR